eukprot:521492-Amphidinium_carterae.1
MLRNDGIASKFRQFKANIELPKLARPTGKRLDPSQPTPDEAQRWRGRAEEQVNEDASGRARPQRILDCHIKDALTLCTLHLYNQSRTMQEQQ